MKSNENRGCQISCANDDSHSDCSESGDSCYRTPLNTPRRNQQSQVRRHPSSDLNLPSMQCCDDNCCCCVASQRDRIMLSPKYFHSQISVKELVKYFNCLQNRDITQTLTGRFSNKTTQSPNSLNWNTNTRNGNLAKETHRIQSKEAGTNLSENVKADDDRFRNVCIVRRKKKPPRQHGIHRTDVVAAEPNQRKQFYDYSTMATNLKGDSTMQGTQTFDTNNDNNLSCKTNTTLDVNNSKISSITGGSNTRLSSTDEHYVSKEKRNVWGPSETRLKNDKNLSNVQCNDTIFSWRSSKHKATCNHNSPKTDKELPDIKELVPSSGSSVMCASNGKYSSDKPHLTLPKKHHRSKTMSIVVDINFSHSGEQLGPIPMHFKADRKKNVLKQSISIPFI